MLRAALTCVFATSIALTGAVIAAAAGPDLVNARLQGAWNLTVTVASYTGPRQPGDKPIGHQATDRIWFESTCPSAGACSARIWGPAGPDPSQAAYYRDYSNTSGFEGTPPSGMVQSGATYAVDIPIGGFGGFRCPPPSSGTRPGQHLSLRVVDAKQSGSGWLATTVNGTESLVAGWGCNGSQPTNWVAETLSIVGHPVGYVAPASRSGVLTVSSLASSLNTPRQAFQSPALVVVNLVVTALVILFVTFPSALFNHTMSENYAEITAALRRFKPLTAAALGGGRRLGRGLTQSRRDLAVFLATLAVGA